MGYIDGIMTENKLDIIVKGITIKSLDYQTKDLAFTENGTFWQGDEYIITNDGYVVFREDYKKTDLKPTGLISIYGHHDYEYWLMLDKGKIIDIWENIGYYGLPKKIQKEYNNLVWE